VKVITTGTGKFADVVKKVGAPEQQTLWTAPQDDKAFMRAVKEGRVMTVNRENVGTKKDFGLIGFHKRPTGLYLVFPRPLKEFAGKRIVGIDYDLIRQPEVKDPFVPEPRSAPKERKGKAKKKQPKSLPLFTASIRFVATSETEIVVEAANAKSARKKIEEQSSEPLDWSKADVKRTITGLRRKG
jgi:hypothetical protein